jgi:hypothetical protein
MRKILTYIIKVYQHSLGVYVGGNCRFYPSCSQYAVEAIEQHGAWRGLWLALKRVGKCHPLHHGGVDLVPARECAK